MLIMLPLKVWVSVSTYIRNIASARQNDIMRWDLAILEKYIYFIDQQWGQNGPYLMISSISTWKVSKKI